MADILAIKLAAETAKQSRALLASIKASAVCRGNNYVVRIGPVFMRIGEDRLPEACGVAKAHLFNRQLADYIASHLVNGDGEQAEVVHISDALDWSIAEIDSALAETAKYIRRHDGNSK